MAAVFALGILTPELGGAAQRVRSVDEVLFESDTTFPKALAAFG
jgi:hypothetical protein